MTLFSRLILLVSNRVTVLVLAVLSLLIGGYSYYLISTQSTNNVPGNLLLNSSTSPQTMETHPDDSLLGETLGVYASGAVNKPGIYFLQADSRISDLIKASGGFSEGIDFEFVTSVLNLAEKLTDASHIHFPWSGELVIKALIPESNMTISEGERDGTPKETSTLVNINTCSREALLDIKGIGESYADKIINNRPIVSFEDLSTRVKIPKTLVEYLSENAVL